MRMGGVGFQRARIAPRACFPNKEPSTDVPGAA